jgi:hypothetical protein
MKNSVINIENLDVDYNNDNNDNINDNGTCNKIINTLHNCVKKDFDIIDSYKCRFCKKSVETRDKLKTHENMFCKKSSIVQKAKLIEKNVDAILEANKKYLI